MTENRTTRMLSLLARNLLLVGAALLVALLLCELLLRLLGISYPVYVWTDPVRGVVHIPGARSSYSYNGHPWIEINSDGMRGPEIPLEHPKGTLRIALLGDSFIEGFEVPYEKTVGEVLARRLSALRGSPVQVLNFGVGGYGTTQELLTLKNEVWKYSPDLVLLAVTTGNDISDNYRPLKQTDYVPYYVYRNGQLEPDSSFRQTTGYRSRALWTRRLLGVVQHSRLAQLVNRVRHLGRRSERHQENRQNPDDELGLRDEVQVPPPNADWTEAWKITEGLLGLMRDESRAHRTPFAVVTLTRGIQVNPVREKKERFLQQLGTKDLYYADRRVAEFGKREGIPVLNLAPTMAVQAEQRKVYFHQNQDSLGVGHWNQEGHRVAGELIASWLAQELASGTMSTAEGRATRESP